MQIILRGVIGLKKKFRDKNRIIQDLKNKRKLKEIAQKYGKASDTYKHMKNILEQLESTDDAQSLDGKQVKINYNRFQPRIHDGLLTSKFIIWLDNNKESTFIAKETSKMFYELRNLDGSQNNLWLFEHFDLTEV